MVPPTNIRRLLRSPQNYMFRCHNTRRQGRRSSSQIVCITRGNSTRCHTNTMSQTRQTIRRPSISRTILLTKSRGKLMRPTSRAMRRGPRRVVFRYSSRQQTSVSTWNFTTNGTHLLGQSGRGISTITRRLSTGIAE